MEELCAVSIATEDENLSEALTFFMYTLTMQFPAHSKGRTPWEPLYRPAGARRTSKPDAKSTTWSLRRPFSAVILFSTHASLPCMQCAVLLWIPAQFSTG
ncbi:hypothetical protein C1H46_044552 [Malus baccata]|uniref:Uncharacterized protein n=1 Tax=Malus baccata TaxID=106549 RepID=A0A540K6R4_MALBA|nr:hypothetical protein C1H46_044552 [Malus baccata]